MKKISTLLLALTLVLSVTAAPVAFSPEKKHAPAKKELVKKVDLSKLPKVENKREALPLGQKAPRVQFAREQKTVSHVRKAAQAFLTPDYAEAMYLGHYYADGDNDGTALGLWQLAFYNDTTLCGWVQFQAADSAHINFEGDVTLREVYFAEADTVDVPGHLKVEGVRWNGSVAVYSFSFSGEDANARQYSFDVELDLYALDYNIIDYYYIYVQYGIITIQQLYQMALMELKDIEVIETGDTYDLAFECYRKIVEPTSASYDGYTDFIAENDTFGVYLSILSDAIEEKTYQQDDLDLDYCYLTDNRGAKPVQIFFENISLDVYFDLDTIFISVDEALGKDGNRYNLSIKYYIPQPENFVDLGAFGGHQSLDDDGNYLYFGFTSDSVHYAQFALIADDIFGSFDLDDLYNGFLFLNNDQDTIWPFINFEAEIVRSQPTQATATVHALGMNKVQYDFTLSFFVAHEPTGNTQTIDITEIPNISLGQYPYEIYGYTFYENYFAVSGADDNYGVSFVVFADSVPVIDTAFVKASDFLMGDGGYTVTYLYDKENAAQLNAGDSISLAVSHVADTTFFKFTFLCQEDGDIYDVNLKYYIPEATDTVRFVADLGQSVDFIYSAGEAYIQAKKSTPADSIYLVSLILSEIDDLYGEFSVNDLYPSDYNVAHIDGTDTTKVVFLTADIKITSVDATTAHAAIYAQGRDNVIYDFSFDFTVRDNFGDDSENALNLTFAHDQFMLSSTIPYDTISAYDGTYMLSARFLTNAATLANGTYSIDDVLDYNHISASHGSVLFYDESYGMYTDFTGAFVVKNLNFYTYAYEEVWYLVSGTATVTDTQIVIAAVNSKGNEVNITINRQEETALEELLLNGAAPRKLIDNGRVVIIRDGKAFGIDGRRIR